MKNLKILHPSCKRFNNNAFTDLIMSSSTQIPVKNKLQLPPTRSDIGLLRPDRTTGWKDWLTTVDHKKIGILYGAFALFFLLIGGIEALLIRAQLAHPEQTLLTAQLYNQLFTMHGTIMVFLAIMPLEAALFNFLIPLQIGARDVAFPRMNSFSLWTFVAGAFILHISWFLQFAHTAGWFGLGLSQTDFVPAGGWFGYVPLTSKEYTGLGTDFWILGLISLAVASTVASLNFIVTILNMRAPGMTMMRLPIFAWTILVMAFLAIFAFPPIMIGLIQLLADRLLGTNFYFVPGGGQPVLWQHLFWVFGHPEVYILVLPAFGVISEIIPTFSRKQLFGYPMMVFSAIVIAFLGFAVWSHHMFTVGLGAIGITAFSLLTMAIAVPTGVKMFNWIGTLIGGRIQFTVPMMFSLSFLFLFLLGGLSGIMHSAAPADAQQHDTYFVVAHFHYVLIGGVLMALIGGIYFWFPLMFGKKLNDKLGYLVFFLTFVGFNVAFGPQHYLGLIGMPRRTHTYLAEMGFGQWNFISTIGAFILGIGILLMVINAFKTALSRKKSDAFDPWDARNLEWSLPIPIPSYNFVNTPIIQSLDAWWKHKHFNQPIQYEPENPHGIHMPSQSWFPLLTSVGFALAGTAIPIYLSGIQAAWYVAITGAIIILLGIYLWAIEGPGGYHLKPSLKNPKKTK